MEDDLPQEYCHIRNSERKVSDKFYLAAADLIGKGLSPREAEISNNWLIVNQCIMIKILYLVKRCFE